MVSLLELEIRHLRPEILILCEISSLDLQTHGSADRSSGPPVEGVPKKGNKKITLRSK